VKMTTSHSHLHAIRLQCVCMRGAHTSGDVAVFPCMGAASHPQIKAQSGGKVQATEAVILATGTPINRNQVSQPVSQACTLRVHTNTRGRMASCDNTQLRDPKTGKRLLCSAQICLDILHLAACMHVTDYPRPDAAMEGICTGH
jgi:hypothetical protein